MRADGSVDGHGGRNRRPPPNDGGAGGGGPGSLARPKVARGQSKWPPQRLGAGQGGSRRTENRERGRGRGFGHLRSSERCGAGARRRRRWVARFTTVERGGRAQTAPRRCAPTSRMHGRAAWRECSRNSRSPVKLFSTIFASRFVMRCDSWYFVAASREGGPHERLQVKTPDEPTGLPTFTLTQPSLTRVDAPHLHRVDRGRCGADG